MLFPCCTSFGYRKAIVDSGFDNACFRRKNDAGLEPCFIEHRQGIQATFVVCRYARVAIAADQELCLMTYLILAASPSHTVWKQMHSQNWQNRFRMLLIDNGGAKITLLYM
jgi:hypothetical protein